MPTQLLVSRAGERLWAAVREEGRTVEFRVESRSEAPRLGRIVKGTVTHIVPALQAAFVDVKLERDAFLHATDLLLPGEERMVKPGQGPPIQDRLKVGRELLVQISRETYGAKGDRATSLIGIPGRLLVLLPILPQIGISRRIYDGTERERLTGLLTRLGGGSCGFVARTAAAGMPEERLTAEATRLLQLWTEIRERAERTQAPGLLHQEPPLTIRLLRDAPAAGLERVLLDDVEERDRALDFLDRVDPTLAARIELYRGSGRMFVDQGLDAELERALRPRVWLPSGGTIVIEPTEALVSIDVNTGRSVRASSQEQTSFETNLEAAREIARQLRLRDLGGIIVIDFVDMDSEEHRRQLQALMAESLESDPARTKIVDFSDIGLMQLTRKRTRGGLHAELMERCSACGGVGRLPLPEVTEALFGYPDRSG